MSHSFYYSPAVGTDAGSKTTIVLSPNYTARSIGSAKRLYLELCVELELAGIKFEDQGVDCADIEIGNTQRDEGRMRVANSITTALTPEALEQALEAAGFTQGLPAYH